MADSCTATQIKYSGNGSQKKFTFQFPYMHFYDVKAALWDESKREYVEQTNLYILTDATTVEFLQAPPLPPESTPNGLNIVIFRDTSLESAETTFYPGSSIRAQDLNSDFEQLRLAAQESRCGLENERTDVQEKVWNKESIKGRTDIQKPEVPFDTVYRNDQIAGRWYGDNSGYRTDQEAVATTGAISERLDPYVQAVLPGATEEGFGHQEGKIWQNTTDSWTSYWNKDANAWVAYANTGPRGTPGSEGPEGPQGIPGPSLKIMGDLPAGPWVEPSPLEVGDIWICEGPITGFPGGGTPQANDSVTWNGERWLNLGPIGIQGQIGPPGNTGPVGPTGPQGDEGPKGDTGDQGDQGNPGTGVNFKGQVATYVDLPFAGNQPNDGWQTLDTMDLWVWNASLWINVGTITQGEQGPVGPVIDIATLPSLPPIE